MLGARCRGLQIQPNTGVFGLWPLAKYISNTFKAYNPGRASNTAKYTYVFAFDLWPNTVHTYFPSREAESLLSDYNLQLHNCNSPTDE